MSHTYRDGFVIDVGSTSVRLLVGNLSRLSEPVIRMDIGRVSGLGHALRTNMRLTGAAVDKTLDAVGDLMANAGETLPGLGACLCTQAVRMAENRDAFTARLKVVTGVTPEILTAEREGCLAWEGSADLLNSNDVLMDLGGGSTELVRMGKTGVPEVVSIPAGAGSGVGASRDAAEKVWNRYFDRLSPAISGSGNMVVLGGTATTLAAIAAGLDRYRPGAVHGRSFPCAEITRVVETMSHMDPDARRRVPCMERGREGIIVAGGWMLVTLCEILGHRSLIISERGIRYGRLRELTVNN